MVYLVLMGIEGASFTNERMNEPAETYGETYEEGKIAEAWAYFWKSAKFAIENRKRLNEQGAGDYTILIAEMESEEAEKPKRELLRLKITTSLAVGLYCQEDEEADEVAEKLRKLLGSRYLITAEPILSEQEADKKRLLRIWKA